MQALLGFTSEAAGSGTPASNLRGDFLAGIGDSDQNVCLQSTFTLSVTVAGLEIHLFLVRSSRLLSGVEVVRRSGQLGPDRHWARGSRRVGPRPNNDAVPPSVSHTLHGSLRRGRRRMACPTCGASNPRSPIAPGYWECRNTITEMLTVMAPMLGRPWISEPQLQSNSYKCGTRYHESEKGVSMGIDCFCGTSSIATCQVCGGRFCGDHSFLVGDRRICRNDLRRLREGEEAQKAAVNAQRIVEEADWSRGFDPMGIQEALAVLITSDPVIRRLNSAREALRPLNVQQFTTACIDYGRSNLKLSGGSFYKGSTVTIIGRSLRKARGYQCWWLGHPAGYGINRAIGAGNIGVSPDGRWLREHSGGEDYNSWVRVSYFDMTSELQKKIIQQLG
jgi:hypothetical protein